MKAAVYEGVGKFAVKEVENPKLPHGGCIIEIEYCAICGTDVKAYVHGNPRMKPPLILGHEFCGRITELDPYVKEFKVGDRVTLATSLPCGRCYLCQEGVSNMCENIQPVGTGLSGAFCKYLVLPYQALAHGNLLKVPDNVKSESASLSEPLGCVINGQLIVGVRGGDTVVVIGAGPIGWMHVGVAKAFGASRVILVQRSRSRLDMAKGIKADETICSDEEDPLKRVNELTGGRGAEVVIVSCPSHDAQADSIKMVRKGGRISFFSSLPKDKPEATLNTNLLHYKELRVCGSSDSRPYHQRLALELLSMGKIDVSGLITHKFPLSRILEGLEIMRKKEGLKVLISPD